MQHNQVIKVLPGENFTPYALARKLEAVAMLESASFDGGRARYSLLMITEAFRVFQRDGQVYVSGKRGQYKVGGERSDILEVLKYFADQHAPPHQDFPFPTGGIGFLSFGFARYCDTIALQRRTDPEGLPEAAFLFGHVLLVFDHYSDLIYLIGLNYEEQQVDLEAELTAIERTIGDLNFTYLQNGRRGYPATVETDAKDRSRYEGTVEALRDEIIAGNLLQAVPSRRVIVRSDMPAIEAYRRLRSSNPAPYLVYLDYGEFQMFAASPEVHVKAKDGHLTMRPIAGTRRRGATESQDLALERELLADQKELAEHLMLVDLARNDLGRVSVPGSVRVTKSKAIERYSRVMHIVSQVESTLAAGKTGFDAVRATFPAGTVSGAPKIRAIETIDALEPHPRGFYAGIVAYIEPGGNLDSCITIRAGLCNRGRLVLQAGAGVVYDSSPEREFTETQEKLAALMVAIGLEVEA